MGRLGSGRGPAARLSDNALRLVGLAFVGWSGAVAAASVATDAGLPVPGSTANAVTTDLEALGSLVAFALAHPAYPTLFAVGLALVVLGENAPLFGS